MNYDYDDDDIDEIIRDGRNRAIKWARGVVSNPKSVIIDTETTGLSDPEIVEIGVVDLEGNTLYHSLVKPIGLIEVRASEIHGHTLEKLAELKAPNFDRIHSDLKESLKGRMPYAYNASFDIDAYKCTYNASFLRLISLGYDPIWIISKMGMPLKAKWGDIMMPYAEFYGDYSEYHDSFTWQKLPGATHGALGDALAALAVIKEMAAAEIEEATQG